MLVNNPTTKTILETVCAMKQGGAEVFYLMIAEGAKMNVPDLIDALKKESINFFGGIFPGVLYGTGRYDEGCIVKRFETTSDIQVVHNLSKGDFSEIGDLNFQPIKDVTYSSVLVVDALSKNVGNSLTQLSNKFGYTIPFIGGGAGFLSLEQQPCVFTNEGYLEDALIYCLIENELKVDVQHGWEKIEGPFIATKTDGKNILELNWENAFEVYQKVLKESAGKLLSKDKFVEVATFYPIGILKNEEDFIVRDPVSVGKGGEIITVGEVPQNSVVYIMNGNKESLLEAAKDVTQKCVAKQSVTPKHTIVINCICRAWFLDSDFKLELEQIVNNAYDDKFAEDSMPQGALTLGEISSFKAGPVEFYNKTIVVGMMS